MNLSDYLIGISNHKLLSKEEEKRLFEKLKQGDLKVRRKIINSNLRLVVNIAKRYTNPKNTLQDLIQEGNIGLIKSVDKFKIELDRRFSTYATFWIKQSILKFMSETRNVIRYPSYVNDIISKINKFTKEYKLSNENKQPSVDELSEGIMLEKEEIKKYINLGNLAYISLEEKFENDKKFKIINLIESSIEEKMIEIQESQYLEQLIDRLKNKEKEILISRYGLYGQDILTLEKLGEKLSITRERVRQIQNDIVSKLKNKICILN